LVVVKSDAEGEYLEILATADYPSDTVEGVRVPTQTTASTLEYVNTSTDGNHILLMTSKKLKVVPRTAAGIEDLTKDADIVKNIAHIDGLHLNVWPSLEFQQ
jgi:hypothetical protein